jgi:2-oxoglutaroyl-CoA hydrolase
MRSRRVGGRQADEWGVATECVADHELEAATDALVEELRSLPPLAQRTVSLINKPPEANGRYRAYMLGGGTSPRARRSRSRSSRDRARDRGLAVGQQLVGLA